MIKILMLIIFISLHVTSCTTNTAMSGKAMSNRSKNYELDTTMVQPDMFYLQSVREDMFKKVWAYGKLLESGDYFYGGWIDVRIPPQHLKYRATRTKNVNN